MQASHLPFGVIARCWCWLGWRERQHVPQPRCRMGGSCILGGSAGTIPGHVLALSWLPATLEASTGMRQGHMQGTPRGTAEHVPCAARPATRGQWAASVAHHSWGWVSELRVVLGTQVSVVLRPMARHVWTRARGPPGCPRRHKVGTGPGLRRPGFSSSSAPSSLQDPGQVT